MSLVKEKLGKSIEDLKERLLKPYRPYDHDTATQNAVLLLLLDLAKGKLEDTNETKGKKAKSGKTEPEQPKE